jgi:hypothetical protein
VLAFELQWQKLSEPQFPEQQSSAFTQALWTGPQHSPASEVSAARDVPVSLGRPPDEQPAPNATAKQATNISFAERSVFMIVCRLSFCEGTASFTARG